MRTAIIFFSLLAWSLIGWRRTNLIDSNNKPEWRDPRMLRTTSTRTPPREKQRGSTFIPFEISNVFDGRKVSNASTAPTKALKNHFKSRLNYSLGVFIKKILLILRTVVES